MNLSMNPEERMIRGAKLDLRGREFIVPPLTFDSLERLEAEFEVINGIEIGKPFNKEQMRAVVTVVHEALLANYPDLQLEELRSLVDVLNVRVAMNVVMGASGLEQVMPGEAVPQAADASPGASSTVS